MSASIGGFCENMVENCLHQQLSAFIKDVSGDDESITWKLSNVSRSCQVLFLSSSKNCLNLGSTTMLRTVVLIERLP